MGDTHRGRERKRSAKSPLDSEHDRRKIEQNMEDDFTGNRAWISSGRPGNKIKDQLKSSDRERRTDGEDGVAHDKSMESHMRGMVASLQNLEQLYSQLDGKVRRIQTDLGKRFQKLNLKHNAKFERLEQIQIETDRKVVEYRAQIDRQNAKIEQLESDLKNTAIDRVKEALLQVEKRQAELEEKLSSLSDARGPNTENFRDLLVNLAKKIEYLESKLKRHDRQFLEVNTDLREKYMSIDVLREEENENILQKVIQHINGTLQNARENAIQLSVNDIDMVYRTGRPNRYSNYPRPVTIIFLRKGIKQMVIAMKRLLGWDTSNISYSDDLTYDVRSHREVLKAIAGKAQYSQHVTRMAGIQIIVDGVPYGADELDILPSDLKRGIPQIKPVKNGIGFRGKKCYLSSLLS